MKAFSAPTEVLVSRSPGDLGRQERLPGLKKVSPSQVALGGIVQALR